MSNLTQRTLVAIVAIPLFVFLSLKGGFFFYALVVLINSLALVEFYRLAEEKTASPQVVLGLVFGFFVITCFIAHRIPGVSSRGFAADVLVLVSILFTLAILLTELLRNVPHPLLNIATTLGGVCYVSTFLGSLVGIRELFLPRTEMLEANTRLEQGFVDVYDFGGYTVITLFVSIWVCDSFAYFVGKYLGKHKLFERVSPKKTWEGAVAGCVGAVGTFAVSQMLFLSFMSLTTALVCGGIVGIGGQFGDLVESLLKRDAGVKDSSALIPGHGGALDRFDSLIFASPLVYVYLKFVLA